MKASVLATSVMLLYSTAALAADADTGCNQLGREIALRAAEQMQAGFDATGRSELAAIAEAVCLEFTAPGAAAASVEAQSPAGETPAAEPEAGRRGLFNLELIPPEERVRRPGLKRP